VYNAAAHLPLLLSSLLNQSEESLQVIAVDDGSTDESLAILEKQAHGDPRLIVLHQDNRGCSAARNRALELARGRWIAFADSDDWLAPHALETWRRRAEEARLELLIGNGFTFIERPDERKLPCVLLRRQPCDEVFTGAQWIVSAVAVREWRHRLWLQLVSRELVTRTGARFIEDIVHEDILWTLQIALAARRVGFAREPLYGYRANPASLMNDPSTLSVLGRARSYIVVIRHLAGAADRLPRRSPLRRALLRQANREGARLLSLMRKRLQDQAGREEIAREFLAAGLVRVMFRGAGDEREFWDALRCWMLLRWHAANPLTTAQANKRSSIGDS
jgi:glycosyltransferase involved in cell wall biosynthesis